MKRRIGLNLHRRNQVMQVIVEIAALEREINPDAVPFDRPQQRNRLCGCCGWTRANTYRRAMNKLFEAQNALLQLWQLQGLCHARRYIQDTEFSTTPGDSWPAELRTQWPAALPPELLEMLAQSIEELEEVLRAENFSDRQPNKREDVKLGTRARENLCELQPRRCEVLDSAPKASQADHRVRDALGRYQNRRWCEMARGDKRGSWAGQGGRPVNK
ncbi:MAG TPA: hypothetical protein VKS79_18645 [Gemmataceae bacterium]|nr:hypothetical protein [Gemmataceae bacterium]